MTELEELKAERTALRAAALERATTGVSKSVGGGGGRSVSYDLAATYKRLEYVEKRIATLESGGFIGLGRLR